MTPTAHVITVSDRVSAGTMVDESGPTLMRLLQSTGFLASGPAVVPDSMERITAAILAAQAAGADMVVTTGGTGLGPRDVTPQATSTLIDYEVPGLAESMRRVGGAFPVSMATSANIPFFSRPWGLSIAERTLSVCALGSMLLLI